MKAFVGGRLFQGGKSKGKTFIDAMKRIIPEAYLVNWVGYGWCNLNNHAWRKGITSHITGGVEYPSPQVNIGSTSTGGRIQAVKADLAKILLTAPVCTAEGEKIALSRRVDKHWRLIGWGEINRGLTIEPSKP